MSEFYIKERQEAESIGGNGNAFKFNRNIYHQDSGVYIPWRMALRSLPKGKTLGMTMAERFLSYVTVWPKIVADSSPK